MKKSRPLGVFILFLMTTCRTGSPSEQRISEMIDANLPSRASVSDVLAFLDSQQIEEFGYKEGEEPVFIPSGDHPRPETRRYVLARIRNVNRTLLKSWDLYIVFYFDDEQKMSEYTMKRIGKGL